MVKTKKYYVVWVGSKPGIYSDWSECQQQIKGFPNAKYKSFKTLSEAETAFKGSYIDYEGGKNKRAKRDLEGVNWRSISVDAACSGNPGTMEYRGVDTQSGEEIFRQGPYQDGTNNVGEFLALVHALALLKKQNKPNLTIYSDSRTAMAWVRNKKAKTTLNKNSKNAQIFNLIQRAELWLQTNRPSNPILKWETEKWGEIPADFGRK